MVDIVAGEGIMIARDEIDLGTVPCFSEDFLYHIVMFLWPVPISSQAPAVNDIADEIQIVRLCML